VTVPSSVTTLGNDAFWNCEGLTTQIVQIIFEQCLSTGKHTIKIELTIGMSVTSVEHSFTIVKPSPGPSSSATGESGMMTTFCVALMLIAAYGAVYALTRRKTENAG
jgi:hypothetical protein